VGVNPSGVPHVTAIIPTCDNYDQLLYCLASMLMHTGGLHANGDGTMGDTTDPILRAIVVDNGTPGGVARNLSAHPFYAVVEAGGNKGWEGGLQLGLDAQVNGGYSPFVLFANDDIHIPPNDSQWLDKMIQTMRAHPDVAAVGPKSNFVTHYQHLHAKGLDGKLMAPIVMEASLLVGFCMLVRRDALDAVGGIAQGLPGGDDFDLSLRLAHAGWKLAIQGDVYVHHWGCQTGARLFPKHWNSMEMIHETRDELIRRHKLRPYLAMMNFHPVPLNRIAG